MFRCQTTEHLENHAFLGLNARVAEGVRLVSRRSTLKAGLAGMAGLSLPQLLAAKEQSAKAGQGKRNKSVILIWMTGGPSHIDTLDVKPEAPPEIRGPFGNIATKLPGIRFCEHLPKMAAMMDRLTVIRSVDCRHSNHEPNMVMQTGNLDAAPRVNPEGDKFPAIASIVAKHRGPNDPAMPPYVVLNMKSRSHVAWPGYLGKQYEPLLGTTATGLFNLPADLNQDRLRTRHDLLGQFDRLQRGLDQQGSMDARDKYVRQAIDLVVGKKAQAAFDITREPEATRQKWGEHPWAQQVLLARRLVEAGVNFVTIDLSNHGASGTWDTHGDNIPPYGGIMNGLRPLLPVFDHLLTTLVTDLGERNLLDDVLVIAMGEFGRTPQIGTQDSSDGRNHWPVVMSMTLAGGGMRHGQVIGATERDAGQIKERPVTPGDLAATIYHHFGVPLTTTYDDNRGRPRLALNFGGEPIKELV